MAASGTALPYAHKPNVIESKGRESVPLGVRHIAQSNIVAEFRGEFLEPGIGIDFVKMGMRARQYWRSCGLSGHVESEAKARGMELSMAGRKRNMKRNRGEVRIVQVCACIWTRVGGCDRVMANSGRTNTELNATEN